MALSNDAILDFKHNVTENNALKGEKYLYKKLAIKFSFYFIISFLFLAFIWYYISMFCVIYKNTQVHLLKDTISSFGISLLFPRGFYLLQEFFAIPALSDKKHKSKCLYNFSKIFQFVM